MKYMILFLLSAMALPASANLGDDCKVLLDKMLGKSASIQSGAAIGGNHYVILGRMQNALTAVTKGFDPIASGRISANDMSAAKAAIAPFSSYYRALNAKYLEAEYVFEAFQAAVLGRRNVGLVGFTGNGKSEMTREAFSNIIFDQAAVDRVAAAIKDHPQFIPLVINPVRSDFTFYDLLEGGKIDLTPNGYQSYKEVALGRSTNIGHVIGSAIPEQAWVGKRTLMLHEGVASHAYGLLDEFGNASPDLKRELLPLLNEKLIVEGQRLRKANTEVIVTTSNTSIETDYRLAEAEGVDMAAVYDRFARLVLLTKNFANQTGDPTKDSSDPRYHGSMFQMMKGKVNKAVKIPYLEFRHIRALQKLVDAVDIPDLVLLLLDQVITSVDRRLTGIHETNMQEVARAESTPGGIVPLRYTPIHLFSKRTRGHLVPSLKVAVVLNWIETGGQRPLIANYADILRIRDDIIFAGPSKDEMDVLMGLPNTALKERSDFSTLITERDAFVGAWKDAVTDFEVTFQRAIQQAQEAVQRHLQQRSGN